MLNNCALYKIRRWLFLIVLVAFIIFKMSCTTRLISDKIKNKIVSVLKRIDLPPNQKTIQEKLDKELALALKNLGILATKIEIKNASYGCQNLSIQ